MNIWFLATEFIPQAGGIATYLDHVGRALVRAEHQVTILVSDPDKKGVEYTPDGVKVVRFTPRYRLLGMPAPADGEPDEHPAFPFNIMAYAPALSYQFAEELTGLLSQADCPPDIVECQDYLGIAYFTLQRRLLGDKRLEKIPIVVHLHGPSYELCTVNQEPRYRFPQYWTGEMEKFCFVAADALVSPSRFLSARVQTTLRRALEMVVIPNPYFPFHDGRMDRPLERGEIVYAGRLELRKGVLPLVKACSRLWRQGVEFRLVLIGGDTEFPARGSTVGAYLRKRYEADINAGRLVITGRAIPRQELYEQLKRAWAVVVPSLWENCPYACIEAMALGKLVIGSTSGGHAELIGSEGQAGYLFDWSQEGDFERVLCRVLAMPEAEVIAMGRRAAERIRSLCSPEVVIPRKIEWYEEVIRKFKTKGVGRVFPVVSPLPRKPSRDEPRSEVPGLLSVVIPFYNLGLYVKSTLRSVVASTYRPLEIIIVDDCSDDPASLDVLEEIEAQYEEVRVVRHTENRGLSAARNTGAIEARGEFIAFVDADDMVEPEFFTKAVRVLERYSNVDGVYSWVRYFGSARGCWVTWNTSLPYLLGHNMASVLAVLRRASFLSFGLNRLEMEYGLEDYDSWVRMVAAGCVFVSIPEMLVRYRVRPQSMLRQLRAETILYLYELVSHGSPELYREHGLELFNLQNQNGPGYLWSQPAADWVPMGTPSGVVGGGGASSELDQIVNAVRLRLQGIPGVRGRVVRKTAKLVYRAALRVLKGMIRG